MWLSLADEDETKLYSIFHPEWLSVMFSVTMDDVDDLRDAIRRLHGLESEYVETVPVVEAFEGMTMWEGDVSVFKVTGHPHTDTAYAWRDFQDTKKRVVAVLKLPPVDSPLLAVRAAVIASIKAAQKASTSEQSE